MEQVRVTARRAHSNDYGDTREKAKGDEYVVSAATADALVAQGWVKRAKEQGDVDNQVQVSGGQGTGKGAVGTGKSGDKKIDIGSGA